MARKRARKTATEPESSAAPKPPSKAKSGSKPPSKASPKPPSAAKSKAPSSAKPKPPAEPEKTANGRAPLPREESDKSYRPTPSEPTSSATSDPVSNQSEPEEEFIELPPRPAKFDYLFPDNWNDDGFWHQFKIKFTGESKRRKVWELTGHTCPECKTKKQICFTLRPPIMEVDDQGNDCFHLENCANCAREEHTCVQAFKFVQLVVVHEDGEKVLKWRARGDEDNRLYDLEELSLCIQDNISPNRLPFLADQARYRNEYSGYLGVWSKADFAEGRKNGPSAAPITHRIFAQTPFFKHLPRVPKKKKDKEGKGGEVKAIEGEAGDGGAKVEGEAGATGEDEGVGEDEAAGEAGEEDEKGQSGKVEEPVKRSYQRRIETDAQGGSVRLLNRKGNSEGTKPFEGKGKARGKRSDTEETFTVAPADDEDEEDEEEDDGKTLVGEEDYKGKDIEVPVKIRNMRKLKTVNYEESQTPEIEAGYLIKINRGNDEEDSYPAKEGGKDGESSKVQLSETAPDPSNGPPEAPELNDGLTEGQNNAENPAEPPKDDEQTVSIQSKRPKSPGPAESSKTPESSGEIGSQIIVEDVPSVPQKRKAEKGSAPSRRSERESAKKARK